MGSQNGCGARHRCPMDHVQARRCPRSDRKCHQTKCSIYCSNSRSSSFPSMFLRQCWWPSCYVSSSSVGFFPNSVLSACAVRNPMIFFYFVFLSCIHMGSLCSFCVFSVMLCPYLNGLAFEFCNEGIVPVSLS